MDKEITFSFRDGNSKIIIETLGDEPEISIVTTNPDGEHCPIDMPIGEVARLHTFLGDFLSQYNWDA